MITKFIKNINFSINELLTPPTYPVVVVIPIYKNTFSQYEEISFNRCLEVLGHYPITLFGPKNLNIQKSLANINANINFEAFDDFYFDSIYGYNELMLCPLFYERFISYKYLLIYQLDAFVFKDQLLQWCDENFDYIGAPWVNETLVKYWQQNLTLPRIIFSKLKWRFLRNCVGNGGFSLRNIRQLLSILLIFNQQASKWSEQKGFSNEDLFWSYFATSYWPFFKIAPYPKALNFSFEYDPEKCYQNNGYELPFGCHAWDKHENIGFWRNFFQPLGYLI